MLTWPSLVVLWWRDQCGLTSLNQSLSWFVLSLPYMLSSLWTWSSLVWCFSRIQHFDNDKITTHWWKLTWTVCTSSKYASPFQTNSITFQRLELPTASFANSTSVSSMWHVILMLPTPLPSWRQGMDFDKNWKFGVCDLLSWWCSSDSSATIIFSGLFFIKPIILGTLWLYWVNFFYTQPFLSLNLCDFLQFVKFFVRYKVYSIKHLIIFFSNLHGSLDKVSEVWIIVSEKVIML